MSLYTAVVSVLVGIFIILSVRDIKAEYSVFATVILGVFILLQILPEIGHILSFTRDLFASDIEESHILLLYKAIGSSFICQYVSELCHECGLDSISSKTELFGKIYLTSLCIPLIENIVNSIDVL